MLMHKNKQLRRTPNETLWDHFLLNLGFSKPLLSEAQIRNDGSTLGLRSIERASEQITGRLAFQIFKWPTRPANRVPGRSILSKKNHIEVSLLANSMYYLYGDRIYSTLSIDEVVNSYDLYTNIRKSLRESSKQISPDSAYWISKEFSNGFSTIKYCNNCKINYYISEYQQLKKCCPLCNS